jgi:hypothetical protein
MFHRARHQLHEMRRIELTLETDFALAKLEAEAAATPEETDEMVRRAIEVHTASSEALEKLRGELPTTLRKLTAGYELRTYWFEIFECLRKITLIGLPIFFPPGSPPQLIFGLIICFLSYGAYCVCSPYIRDDDDFLAQVAQVIIFFSLVSSVVTNAFPEDPLMKVLLPALLAVPVILTFIFETPLLEFLRSFTEPDKEGNVGLAGQFILAFRRHTLRITDRLVGAVGQEEAKSGMRAVWEEHSKELGASALVRVRSSQSSFTTLSTSEPSARHADIPTARLTERFAPNDGGAAISQQSPNDGGAAPKVWAQVLQVRGNLRTLVHAADQASQEATAAFAAAMTVASEGKKTPVPDDHSILGNKTSAPWTFLSNRTAVAAAAAKVVDKAPVDKAAKAAKAAKADKAVMNHLLQLDPAGVNDL